ncbi:unnamed protein product [Paramecium primaurelia]|uniref:Transmembrane protein n=1 Tax=Paramecium primaurelia TaxID=5886 RepID=A0A8S1LNL4_PARPR|nr:unnamed protein product [Paramecium primaurelia]
MDLKINNSIQTSSIIIIIIIKQNDFQYEKPFIIVKNYRQKQQEAKKEQAKLKQVPKQKELSKKNCTTQKNQSNPTTFSTIQIYFLNFSNKINNNNQYPYNFSKIYKSIKLLFKIIIQINILLFTYMVFQKLLKIQPLIEVRLEMTMTTKFDY